MAKGGSKSQNKFKVGAEAEARIGKNKIKKSLELFYKIQWSRIQSHPVLKSLESELWAIWQALKACCRSSPVFLKGVKLLGENHDLAVQFLLRPERRDLLICGRIANSTTVIYRLPWNCYIFYCHLVNGKFSDYVYQDY